WRELFTDRRDRPPMAEWIDEDPIPFAPEHLLHRHIDLRAGFHGPTGEPVHIVDLNHEHHGRSADRWWGKGVQRGRLLADKHPALTQGEPGDSHPPVGEAVVEHL